ncbi:stemmadenine O-acetyltransferase-like [Impatiens glandulifera]|uniref:stemmadenine O-acetyltransferase-like n=1 Tax=Impatiens glandulifera TaxID=253017 RepID=UPI001FB0B884|nr:stemmadenine O-acetyltransferase-like [Impatiens glandulifera]
MAELKIKVLSNEFVRPSSPTNYPFKKYHLSLLDQSIPRFFIPSILYYQATSTTTTTQHELISSRLRESLSQTLTKFYPFAGRLNRADNSIDCNDMGVRYLEAKVDSNISEVIECHEARMVDPLIPNSMGNDEEEDEIFAIQVNYFNCGGIAIGTYIPHQIADGVSFFTFIKSWAAISCQHDINIINTLKPSFVSSSLFPPKENHDYNPLSEDWKETLVTRRFVFDASHITSIREKARIDHDYLIPTRVEAVSAFIWKYATVDKPGKQYIATHNVNLRSRMVPPLSEHAIGNLFGVAYAYCSYEDSNDLAVMGRKVREGIRRIDDEYIRRIRGDEGYEVMIDNWMKMGELVTSEEANFFRFSSWCRFPIYDVDFGMGKPVWASIGSLNIKNSAFLMDSKCGNGVDAWVTMNQQDMARLSACFC